MHSNYIKNSAFVQLGVIPNGFRMKDGTYEDIIRIITLYKNFLKKVQPFGVLNCIISEGRGINDRRKVKTDVSSDEVIRKVF